MKPRQTNLNELEESILNFMAKDFPPLKEMINQLSVLSREFTGVGSYTNFQCLDSSSELDRERIGLQTTVSIPNVSNGLGGVMFCEEGKPKLLELYTYGDEKWDGEFEGFKLNKEAEPVN
jgi:hypothetical protein